MRYINKIIIFFSKNFIDYLKYRRRLFTPQRVLLDELIIPSLSENAKSVLFVGVDYYNLHLFKGCLKDKTVTIDPKKECKRWGSSRHITGRLPDNIDALAQYSPYDLVIFNGVYGWGLNERVDLINTLNRLKNLMSEHALLVFGFNEEAEHNPLKLSLIDFELIFQPATISCLGGMSDLFLGGKINYRYYFLKKI